MFRRPAPRSHWLPLAVLATLVACQDGSDSLVSPRPQFAQGDNGTWTVNSLADPGDGTCDETECTLREAIAAAASGDRIGFAAGLTGAVQLTVGALTITDKSLTIDGDGRVAVDGQQTTSAFTVTNTIGAQPIVALAGLTIENAGTQFASAINVGGVALTLDHVDVLDNATGATGAGLSLRNGPQGIRSDVTIRNSRIARNNAAGDGGGGIAVIQGAQLTLINSTVDSNTTPDNGGGILNDGTLIAIGSLIADNEGASSGAIKPGLLSSTTLVRTTISGNRAESGVGGINGGGALMALRSVTMTNNDGGSGVGGIVSSTATAASSIIAGNTGSFSDDCTGLGRPTSLGHNLATSVCGFQAEGDVTVTAAQVFSEVLEQDLADNGGPTRTHALIARGRAVDAGYCPGETTDQRGFARPVDVALMPNAVDGCDIGAYEAQGPVVAVADLMVSQSVNKTSVKQGDLLTYSIRVQNLGPATAPNVVVTDLLPSGATFVSASHNRGTHTAPPAGSTGTVTWSVGDLLDQANEVGAITVTVLVKGKTTITNTASVTGDVSDPNTANNSAAITVSVGSGSAAPGSKNPGKKK
jgi:uncharacterized repeat protein (TIGR01451 family)/CSLREA domain-containing protein